MDDLDFYDLLSDLERVGELIAAGDAKEAYEALDRIMREYNEGLRPYDQQVIICNAWGKSANQIQSAPL